MTMILGRLATAKRRDRAADPTARRPQAPDTNSVGLGDDHELPLNQGPVALCDDDSLPSGKGHGSHTGDFGKSAEALQKHRSLGGQQAKALDLPSQRDGSTRSNRPQAATRL